MTLDERLRALGGVLDVADRDVVVEVLARLDDDATAMSGNDATRGVLRLVGAAVLVAALAVAAVPSSRSAVADWLGFDGVDVERRPDLDVPDVPDPLDRGRSGTVTDVDGVEVVISEIPGSLTGPVITKTVGDGTDVIEVTVRGAPGLWIDGEPHEVVFLDADGEVVARGFAGNTLLWQDGDVIRRLEGFTDVAAAVDHAETLTAGT